MKKNKQYKSVLAMVWGVSGSLRYKIQMTYIIIKKRLYKKINRKLRHEKQREEIPY